MRRVLWTRRNGYTHVYGVLAILEKTMKCGIIMSSELAKNGRWDAGFHLLNAEYAERAAALAVTMRPEEVVALLSDDQAIPTQVLQLLAPLTRGNAKPGREQLLKAVVEYPFLSLAIIKDKGRDLLAQQQAELQQQAQKMADVSSALEAAGPSIPGLEPIPHQVRGLLTKNRYVQGVVYFDGELLSIPPETSETAYVADCWVIELGDWTGPEVIDALVADGNVPVPRRYEDLGKPVGWLPQLADHTQNYGKGWR